VVLEAVLQDSRPLPDGLEVGGAPAGPQGFEDELAVPGELAGKQRSVVELVIDRDRTLL
jgi:hypothetical protein